MTTKEALSAKAALDLTLAQWGGCNLVKLQDRWEHVTDRGTYECKDPGATLCDMIIMLRAM